MFTGSRKVGKKLRRGVRPVALVVSLAVSALITGVAMRSPDLHWLAWFCFLTLFAAKARAETGASAAGTGSATLRLPQQPKETAEIGTPTLITPGT